MSSKIDRLTCVLIVVSTRWFHRHRSRLSASTELDFHSLFPNGTLSTASWSTPYCSESRPSAACTYGESSPQLKA